MTKPISEHKAGGIKAAIFENKSGKSISLQKSFKKDDKWVNNKLTLLPNDIKKVIEVLNKI